MEEYIVSARKYRPASFDTVVGQRALTTTLLNAIRTGKLAHAYLFCGPRGVGKTTCARIFAKTINCLNPKADGEACNECESCRAFEESRSMNIHELDAASNNSVDDIRELIEQVRIPPQIGRYKVFIIDEVHMLSAAAFNAFLKTLEEPPSYVIFILATTEKHKILPTILSRCQVFDFARMTIQNTVDHLAYVAQKEGYTAEPEALNLIAQKADGGMRDALSIFDQMASFCGGQITLQRTLENLNILDSEYYFRLTDNALQGDVQACMLLLNEVIGRGFDAGNFIAGLASHMRNLLVAIDPKTLPLLETSDQMRARYQTQAKKCKPRFLYRAIRLCNDCDLGYRQSRNKRLQVEICLVQLAQMADEDDVPGAGLCPAKILKPIFRQEAPSTGAPVAAQAPAPQNKAPEPIASPASNIINRIAGRTAAPQPHEQRSFGIINIRAKQPAPNNAQQTAAQVAGAAVAQNNTPAQNTQLVPEVLMHCWRECANQLPKDDSALAQRMQGLQPELTAPTAFRVVVAGEHVAEELRQHASSIENYISRNANLQSVTMQIVVEIPKTEEIPLSKPEIFRQMNQDFPALEMLRTALGLELL